MGDERMRDQDFRSSFTVGTAAKQGRIKVFFDENNVNEKIKLALTLYDKYVKPRRMK